MSETLLRIALLNAGLAALLAVPAALATCFLRRRPAVVHGLWLLVLLKLVTPPLVPVPLGWASAGPAAPLPEVVAELPTCPALEPPPAAVADTAGTAVARPAAFRATAVSAVSEASSDGFEPSEPFAWSSLLAAVWLAGTLLVWGVAWSRLRRLWRVVDTLGPASEDIRDRVKGLCRRLSLRRVPEVWLVPGVVPPLLVALWSPRLLVPSRLWERLDDAGRDTLLLHELAHLRRGDWLVRWLELLVVGLFWWYPLAWWASRALRDAEELCCDAWVVWAAPENASAYADTLVETVAFLSGAAARVPPLASGAAPVRFLHRRLAMILRCPAPRRLSPAALVVLVLGGVCLLPLGLTEAQSPTTPPAVSAPAPMSVEDAVMRSPSCRTCHDVPGNPKGVSRYSEDERPTKMHDEITKLMNDLAKMKAVVKKTEDELRAKLQRFEKATGAKPATPPSADRRLDDMEKKLELLLKEMKDLRKSRGRSPDPNANPMAPAKATQLIDRARTAYNEGKYTEAIDLYDKALATTTSTDLGLKALGGKVSCYASLQQMKEVQECVVQISKLLPKLAPAAREPWVRWLEDYERVTISLPQRN